MEHAGTVDDRARPWDPVLRGALASRAWQTGREIARTLAERVSSTLHEASDATLFWAYASTAIDETWADEAYARSIEDLSTALSAPAADLSLFGGLTGAAWIDQHVSSDGETGLPPLVDSLLARTLEATPWPGPYDLVSGLAGFGVYLIDRQPSAATGRALRQVISHLERAKTSTEFGDAWRTEPNALSDRMRDRFPNGCYDLGVAHGTAGVVAFYAATLEARTPQIDTEPLHSTIASATQFILSHTQEGRDGIQVAGAVAKPGTDGLRTRNAWCYGDLGVCVALARASVATNNHELRQRVRSLSHACAQRSLEDDGVIGWGLCHGSAGTAHALNRLRSHFDDDDLIASGARRWFEHVLDTWACQQPALDVGAGPICILTGPAGVALALLAASTSLAPSWDRRMMLDL